MITLEIAICTVVPLRIMEYERRGGPTDADFERARGFATILGGVSGDVLMYGGKKREAAGLFNQLTDALAVMAFAPGGVRFGSSHWEGTAP